MGTTEAYEGRGRLLTRSQIADIADRIQLLHIDSFRLYETPDPPRVAEIENSLNASGHLINPVIVDPTRRLLIDGHHRVRAFARLGLDQIPAFTVDYLSADVSVRGWSRATTASADEVKRLLQVDAVPTNGPWSVISKHADRAIDRHHFETSHESASFLNHLSEGLTANGHNVWLTTETDAFQARLSHSYISPVIDKNEVLDAVTAGRVFPYEINRHLIADRPLGLNLPLEAVGGVEDFRRSLEWTCQEMTLITISPGFRDRDRLYDERVTLFCPTFQEHRSA